MNLQELTEAAEKLSDADKKAILETEFDAELEKEASDNLAQADLENALYAWGMFRADLEVEAAEAGEEGLSKEASEQFEQAEAEIAEAVEAGIEELGLNDIEDDAEMHKTAMAAAAVIFEGYSDQMEKWAARSKKKDGKGLKGMYHSLKGKAAKGLEAAKKHAGKAGKLLKKHPGKAAGAAAGAAALGYGAHKLMHKKAADLSAAEMVDLTLEKQATVEVIADGIEKLAAHGAKKGGMFAKAGKHLKDFHKKHLAGHGKTVGTHAAAAGAGAAGGAYLAHRMSKKAD